MKSNSLYTQLIKHSFLIVAILSMIVGLNSFIKEDIIVVNDELTKFDLFDLFIAMATSVLMIIFWLLIKDKVIVVKLGGQNITICENGEEEQINWLDIESLSQLIFIQPPLYKLRIKEREGYYLFVTQPFSISFGFGTYDMSEMGSIIKKKKRQLGI
ncbi:MAG: hypothetical protein RIG77_10415 [Cyclobacteriaceae bacterium]